MQIRGNITPTILNTATSLLAPFVPDLSPTALVKAIKNYKEPADADRDNRPERPLTRREAAALLGCSLQSISRMMNDGRLRRIRLSEKSVRVCPDSLRALLAGRAADMESEG
ncbi:MAG: helix-turn-helix transcriptional regulator [Lentisphaeria bacterium]|jgi:predicted DNA-binding transcriptional regulator AlpA